MAFYKNTVTRNTISSDGFAGVQLNENTANQYLDGNVISNNTIGADDLLHSTTAGNGSTVGVSTFVASGARRSPSPSRGTRSTPTRRRLRRHRHDTHAVREHLHRRDDAGGLYLRAEWGGFTRRVEGECP